VTLARGTDRLASARLVLRRIAPDDLPFFTRIHALPEVATWLHCTLASYEALALGYLAVVRKEDSALIGRCVLMDLAVESPAPGRGIRRGWFGREQAPVGVMLTLRRKPT
jgi:hypothetical protein